MRTLCVILARAGSKGFPAKNIAPLRGRPLIVYTLSTARESKSLDRVVVSTDGPEIAKVVKGFDPSITVISRPPELATDTATVDSAARHAVETAEREDGRRYDAVVILYGNVPIRPSDLIERAVQKLALTGCDSVQSVCPVGKNHPYWMKKLGGPDGDVLEQNQPNQIYRRQDLPPLYMLDGGIIAVTRQSLFTVRPDEPHAFLGVDRRAIVTRPGSVVDVDEQADLLLADAALGGPVINAAPQMFSIGARSVGHDLPVYVIAELGVNHDGSLEKAIQLTHAAKSAGADAVKMQLFDPEHLLSSESELAGYQRASAVDPHSMLRALQLPPSDMRVVKNTARKLDLGFIVTCFSIELAPALFELDPDAVKIASPDCVNLPLIRAVLSLGKPLLISTGTCTEDEVRRAGQAVGPHPLAFLRCVSAYPVPDGAPGLAGINRTYGRPAGYSDHTTEPRMGMYAVLAGARVVEKHLTLDRSAPGPDHAASFDPQQFAQYVQYIRQAQRLLGSGEIKPLECEMDVRRVSRQSVCAVNDLPAGHVIRREDVTVKRPGTGIPAASLTDVIGKSIRRAVRANHLLHDGDVEV